MSTIHRHLALTTALLTVLSIGGVRPPVAAATGPTTWVQSGYEEFGAGELVSASLDAEGGVRLAPQLVHVGDTPEAYVWAVDQAPDGSVLVSAGTEGRIYRFAAGFSATDGADPSDGAETVRPELFFEAEGAVHAMALGPDEHLYVAASPGGAIWRLPLAADAAPAQDVPEPWYSTGTRYVWSLAVAADGTVYAGTGDSGAIHRVRSDGTGGVLYDSRESHVTALALDGAGNLLAGTSDNGHLYRVAPDGDVFVLFDAPMKQITGIVTAGGQVYFSALEQGAGTASEAGEGTSEAGSSSGGDEVPQGAVYLLHEDGFIEQLWSSPERSPYALERAAEGVVVGTGDQGRLLQVQGPSAAVLGDADAAQITALRARDTDVIVGTSNLGRVYRLRRAYRDRGEYVSQVKDTTTVSRWGRLRWRGTQPDDATLRFSTRSGNTAEPDDTWSDWSASYADPTGSPITSPPARFIQWKAELTRGADGDTPVLQWVELVYVQRNLRPEIGEFTVHPAGVIYRQSSTFEDSLPIGRLPSAVREALAEQQGRGSGANAAGGGSAAFLGQAYWLPGSQTFTWDASDANGDGMTFALLYRGESESEWKPIATGLTEMRYLWDTTTVPDGLYRARVVASDAPSNPAGEQLEGERSSQPLVVDNTAPRIDNLSAVSAGGVVRVSGSATDATSLIRAMEYAVDGGDWHAVLPADGLPDAGTEEIGFSTIRLEPGEHTIVVRVTDTALNSGTAKVVVSVE